MIYSIVTTPGARAASSSGPSSIGITGETFAKLAKLSPSNRAQEASENFATLAALREGPRDSFYVRVPTYRLRETFKRYFAQRE